MSQYLKLEVQQRILDAALTAFATVGFEAASVAAIAAEAGVSTGNVYRYFDSKQTLFDAVVPESFPRTLKRLVRARLHAAREAHDPAQARRTPGSAYRAVSDELVEFSLENRLRVLVLLERSAGTRYEKFADELVELLVEGALDHARSRGRAPRPSAAASFALRRIYANFLSTMAAALALDAPAPRVREAIESYTTYHLSGLSKFIEEELCA
jgi:AcrR family transcriptional regulator